MQLLQSVFVLSLVSLVLTLPITSKGGENKATAYNPCPADILFAIDASNDALTTMQFNSQINLLKNTIVTPSWNNFERIGLAWYNSIASTHYGFGTMNTKREFDLYTGNAKLANGTDFTDLLQNLLQMPRSISDPFSLNTFIFLSSLSTNDIQTSIKYAQQLKSYGSLNIIILGTGMTAFDIAPLAADNVIVYNFGAIREELKNFVINNLKCGNAPITTTTTTTTVKPTTTATTTVKPSTTTTTTVKLTTTTTTTVKPSTTTTTTVKPTTTTTTTVKPTTTLPPATTTTTIPPPTTIPQIKKRCNALVSIAIDASSDILDEQHFDRQILFIRDTLTVDYKGAPWHKTYHNVALVSYAGSVIDEENFGQMMSNQFDDGWIDNVQQADGMSLKDLLPAMNELELDSEMQLNSIIFISQTLKHDIRECHEGAAELLKRGSLIFVAMGSPEDVDVNLLKTLSHTAVISWPDMLVYDHQLLRREILGNLSCDEE